MKINKITIFDTSICTENNGDKIIMEYASKEINNIFKNSFCVNIPTHDVISKPSYSHINSSNYSIVCGTNLLSSNMNKYNQWKINLFDSTHINNVILLGVGWWQYQGKPNIYTKILLKRVLSKKFVNSVRDSYTEKMLKSIGISNVINTGCPTMWGLTKNHCDDIPRYKSDNVIVTLTDYNKDLKYDKELLEMIFKHYKKVYFWIQSYDDYDYIKSLLPLKYKEIEFVMPTLEAYKNILSSSIELDYVGTRLHAGIMALNYKKRTLIIGIDNRAIEMRNDFKLPVVERRSISTLEHFINGEIKTDIKIPTENIGRWKAQF